MVFSKQLYNVVKLVIESGGVFLNSFSSTTRCSHSTTESLQSTVESSQFTVDTCAAPLIDIFDSTQYLALAQRRIF
jgi:hypothetical protein